MESKLAEVNGARMRWEEQSTGQPVVLIHGIPTGPQVRSLNVHDALLIADQLPNLSVPVRLVCGDVPRNGDQNLE